MSGALTGQCVLVTGAATAGRREGDGDVNRRFLRGGDVEVELDGVDLRYLKVDGFEVVRRIYAAVRDHNWATLPGELVAPVEVIEDGAGTRAAFVMRHRGEEIDLTSRGVIAISPAGELRIELVATPERPFRYNRIGFCVLHPPACEGARYRGLTPSGAIAGTFPRGVAPQGFADGVYVPLFPSVSALDLELEGGAAVAFGFEGDLFETEDQRNWSDASYKTYCTPLALGTPHRATPGREIRQVVTISTRRRSVASRRADAPDLVVGGCSGRIVPPLGSCAPAAGDEPNDAQVLALRSLGLAHLRVDADARDPGAASCVAAGRALAERLGCQVELALRVDAGSDVAAIAAALAGHEVARVIALDAGARSATPTESASAAIVTAARHAVPAGVPVLAGTDMNFCEINRTRPAIGRGDGIAYPVAAQVHAFDDRSILETPTAHGDQVATALAIAAGSCVAVSPITLRQRFNPVAIEDAALDDSALPPSVDTRQREPLAAAFLLASVAAAAAAGAASLTYFRITGWEGLWVRPHGSRAPALFPSQPGERFPAFAALAALAGLRGAPLLTCESRDPLAFAGIALECGGAPRVLVVNVSDVPREARVELAGAVRAVALEPHSFAVLDS